MPVDWFGERKKEAPDVHPGLRIGQNVFGYTFDFNFSEFSTAGRPIG
jgi:hypothetical protein